MVFLPSPLCLVFCLFHFTEVQKVRQYESFCASFIQNPMLLYFWIVSVYLTFLSSQWLMALGLEKCFFLHSLGCLNFVFILDNLFFAVFFFFSISPNAICLCHSLTRNFLSDPCGWPDKVQTIHLIHAYTSNLLSGISFFYLFFNFTILYWFCHIINMNPPQVYTCSPSWTLLPLPSLYHPSVSSSAPAPSIQYRPSNLDWQLVSYMILYPLHSQDDLT